MLVGVFYLALMVCIHHHAKVHSKVFSRVRLSLSLIAAGILIANYFILVSVIPQSVSKGETDGIALLSQYNPHGVFIALEELGYILMTLSLLMVYPTVRPVNRIHNMLRLTLLFGFPLAVVSLALVSIEYGTMREYIFEVIIISIAWLQLIIVSSLFSIIFRKELKTAIIRRFQKTPPPGALSYRKTSFLKGILGARTRVDEKGIVKIAEKQKVLLAMDSYK